MCGIVACKHNKEQIQSEIIKKALKKISHRGPDSNGIYISPNGKTALGHARLSIIDIENGKQPIIDKKHKISVVVNGEFYEYKKIREDLIKKGYIFQTNSDSEILIFLYLEYGYELFEHLRGEFSFVLYDEKNDTIFAARDRFGIKPFCYYKDDEKFLIASESKALFEFGIEKAWDEYSFMHSANMHYRPTNKTLFKNIYQLMPGHFLIFKNNNLTTHKYWDLNYKEEADIKFVKTEQEYIEEFRELLFESIKVRLISDVPVCFHLSGGLDSSSVVGIAQNFLNYTPQCFTIAFDGKENYDEQNLARETAKLHDCKLTIINVGQSDIFTNLKNAVYYSEGLAVNGHISCKYLLNKKIKKSGYKVALTGEGSDETLAGYPHLRQDLFNIMPKEKKEQYIKKLYETNLAITGVEIPQGNGLNLDCLEKKLNFIPSFLAAKSTIGYKINEILSNDIKQKYSNTDFYNNMLNSYDYENQIKNRHIVNQSLYFWIKLTLANYILDTLGDGCEMSSSIEGRLPFLDHKLFEYAKNLPMNMKIKGTCEKYILKEAAKPYITDSIYKRQKHPFMAPPITRFYTNKDMDYINDVINSEKFKSISFFNYDKIKKMFKDFHKMNTVELTAFEPVLMFILTTALLNESFNL